MIRRGRGEERRLATVLFTDMVGSTERAIELGDRAWRAMLRRYHRAIRSELRRFGGHEVDSAGDGFFATFEQPAQAVRCALAIRAAVRPLGLSVRCGLHTGEVEPMGPKVGGVAVHLAARVLSAADPDQILATSTIRELVAGSELTFADAGMHRFKGFAEEWRVHEVTGPEPSAATEPIDAPAERDARQRRVLLAAGGLIGAAVVVGLAVLLGLSGQPPAATARADTVVRIDADDRVASVVPVARAPVALALADAALWVASEAGTITRVELSTLATEVVGGVGIPTAMAVADGSAWVAQGYEARMTRIDAESVEVRDTLTLHARRIAGAGGAVWATDDVADRVVRVAVATAVEDGAVTLEPASGPRGIAVDGTSVWVANERAGTLVELDQASLAVIGHEIGLGSAPSEVAVGGGSVWVTSLDADTLYRIDPGAGQLLAAIEVCDQPDAVVASDDGVWVACRASRVVRRLAGDGSFVVDVPVPGVPAALALAEDGVWVALRES